MGYSDWNSRLAVRIVGCYLEGLNKERLTRFIGLRSERVRRLSKEAFWIVLGQALAVMGSLVGVRLLTGLLSPLEYGELALGMTAATLVNQTVLAPVGNGATRFFALAQEQGDLGGYLSVLRQLVLLATGVIFFIMLFAMTGLLVAGRTGWIALASAAFVFAILSGYNTILSGIQNAARQRSIVALHQGIESWARFLAAAGLVVLLHASSTVAMAGYSVGMIFVLGSQFLFFRGVISRDVTGADDGKIWRERIWKYSLPFATWGIFTWAQLASDRWALGLFTTTQQVGLYAVLFQLGYYPILTASAMAMQFLAPIFYQRAGDASDGLRKANVNELSWRLTGFALGLTGVVFLVTFLFHGPIFRILVGREYASVSHLLPWMLLAGGLFAAGQTVGLNLMSQMKTRAMSAIKIVTSSLGIIFSFVGAYWDGTRGVVFANVLFSALYFLWMAAL